MSAKSDVFFKTKRDIIKVIDYRLNDMRSAMKILKKSKGGPFCIESYGYDARIDELESLRNYIRNGMLWDTRPGRKPRRSD